ncbi:hypothetical protein AR457_06205 [Streptomyces agglomeratus]|uniref:DUF3140 domain-containing protein n=2 Tax=Streptomyces agglomeratus TaxID=285458 RepID=A0A1E5P3M5_9ACTN|nr:DUF3140 domain-containing protein [Streptomyces agglomeratus]OEJ24122.1 hypothetical protein AS594_06130 [Streptomyces agglomeratus]OEJ41874.1 hypothetical protein BGK70_30440 [Streptomyces agglomeratus]OEJ43748.1 hypothetical protein AR457_06205 [Streptomyces agglomeratus]OEJ54366.1 hypothetical protein BGK72_29760 [Streptomyces agglomeratus]OEJ56225.1 hypothetical protein BGM19_39310 [Streptomyces agglomeratus]
MDGITALELEALWDDFHRVVNMTSQELSDWLRTSGADESGEPLPERAGTDKGRQVLAILRKRRTDLTEDDVAVMRQVVETVSAQRRTDLEPTAGDSVWRRRLMTLGHDPLKPA